MPVLTVDRPVSLRTHLLGWQGVTLTVSAEWNPASYGGDWDKGHLRVDDEDGPRLELRWETPRKSVDLPRSVDDFLNALGKKAKKEKRVFERERNARVVSPKRKRKAQLQSFGWRGNAQPAPNPSQGYGVAWQCEECGRVLLAHILGRGEERPQKTLAMASDALGGMECHGSGGWATWSAFGLQLDVPEEFRLKRAKLLTGRIELEWMRSPDPSLLSVLRRPDRLIVQRLSAANVLLELETLDAWTTRVLGEPDKRRRFSAPIETTMRDHDAFEIVGRFRDLRLGLRYFVGDKLGRRRTPPPKIVAWHCAVSNKLFALDAEMSPSNAHVPGDVLDSLVCH